MTPVFVSSERDLHGASIMGRKANVRYWQRRGGGYSTTLNGSQVELALGSDDQPDGPTYKAAQRRLIAMQNDEDERSGPAVVASLPEAAKLGQFWRGGGRP